MTCNKRNQIHHIENTRYETKAPIDHSLPFSSSDNSANVIDSSVPIIEILEIKQHENANINESLNDNIILHFIFITFNSILPFSCGKKRGVNVLNYQAI